MDTLHRLRQAAESNHASHDVDSVMEDGVCLECEESNPALVSSDLTARVLSSMTDDDRQKSLTSFNSEMVALSSYIPETRNAVTALRLTELPLNTTMENTMQRPSIPADMPCYLQTQHLAQPDTQSLANYKPTIGDTMSPSMKASPSNERNVFKGQLVDIATNVTEAELTCCFTRQAARDFTIDELAIALSQIPEQHRLDGNITIKLLVEEGFLVEDQHIAAITIGENGLLQLHKFNESLDLIVTDSYDDDCTCVEIDLEML